MLTIQKASAGSGKTYTLAKSFILHLLFWHNEKGEWFLRNPRQIEDALRQILAITFTNKATNEMKQRIVDNLSLLSLAASQPITPDLLKTTPYLKEFHEISGKSYRDIGFAAQNALKVILNQYSLFKISTIDSFFQEILRTFTYEANLNESYQVEIDSSFVTDSALDAAFHALDTHPSEMGTASFWLKTIMKDESRRSQQWNPFNKKINNKSIYGQIRNALFQLEKEDFKKYKERIYKFYDKPAKIVELMDFYTVLREKGIDERQKLLDQLKNHVVNIEALMKSGTYDISNININFLKHLAKIKALKLDDEFKNSYDTFKKQKSVFKANYREKNNPIDIEAMSMYKLLDIWQTPSPDSYYKNWRVYGELTPFLGLILEIKNFLEEVLKAKNLIQLSETGFILKKIIGKDDAPFVFERLGNRIDNYLIDEFQDTSKMQWEIIYPLLNEGVAKDKDSLIIGDPKQSIYRFRNADHTLITKVVPDTFNPHEEKGDSEEDNTNWRSHTKIVKFNNFFFKTLANALSGLSSEKGNSSDINHLYSNVVQTPSNKLGKGYVEIRLFKEPSKAEQEELAEINEDGTGKTWYDKNVLPKIAPLINSLKERGYRQNEIGILVSVNEDGKKLVEALVDYNETNPSRKIDFISEESLFISSSSAVNLVVGVIEKLAKPGSWNKKSDELQEQEVEDSETGKEKSKRSRYIKWNDVKVSYEIYAKDHPDVPPAQRLMTFLSNPDFENSLPDLLASLPTPTIAAIVEMAIKNLVDESLRKTDAIFLASFQDMVNEYSATHHNDPVSFMEWWRTKGIKAAIGSPEGIDAVQIMTIHKSKGLEFKCVIVPFATDFVVPGSMKDEWRWILPRDVKEIKVPPILPIKTTSVLIGSHHEKEYREYFDNVLTDNLNKFYVAFTRARNELYVFSKEGTKSGSFSDFLSNILKGKILPPAFHLFEMENVCKTEDLEILEDQTLFKYGEPFSIDEIREEILKQQEKEKLNPKPVKHFFEDYYINNRRPRLRSSVFKVTPLTEL